ncbi:MAG: esterase family protein [Saprospiraceae bacterium]|nr:esterase family protein [Saprospiraceae bacterium]
MSSFNTVQLSDQNFEKDGLRFLTVKSKNLKARGDICFYVPEVPEDTNDLPIYILLHGVYGSAWVWAFKGGAHHTAKRLISESQIRPAIIAMPSDGLWGDGSGYIWHSEKNFAEWIVSEVPLAIRENCTYAGEDSPLCIGGLSMGGFGALRLGALYSKKFKAISAHSAITRFEEMGSFVEESLHSYTLEDDVVNAIEAIRKNKEDLPPLRLDCGLEDDLLEANRTLHSQLKESVIDHIYEEFNGGHEWPYWQKHLESSLRFFDKHCRD